MAGKPSGSNLPAATLSPGRTPEEDNRGTKQCFMGVGGGERGGKEYPPK